MLSLPRTISYFYGMPFNNELQTYAQAMKVLVYSLYTREPPLKSSAVACCCFWCWPTHLALTKQTQFPLEQFILLQPTHFSHCSYSNTTLSLVFYWFRQGLTHSHIYTQSTLILIIMYYVPSALTTFVVDVDKVFG